MLTISKLFRWNPYWPGPLRLSGLLDFYCTIIILVTKLCRTILKNSVSGILSTASKGSAVISRNFLSEVDFRVPQLSYMGKISE
jgi:hypothetical protein